MDTLTYRQLLARARRLARSGTDAEDLVQETLIAALQTGREERPWLYGVLRRRRCRPGARRGGAGESDRRRRSKRARPALMKSFRQPTALQYGGVLNELPPAGGRAAPRLPRTDWRRTRSAGCRGRHRGRSSNVRLRSAAAGVRARRRSMTKHSPWPVCANPPAAPTSVRPDPPGAEGGYTERWQPGRPRRGRACAQPLPATGNAAPPLTHRRIRPARCPGRPASGGGPDAWRPGRAVQCTARSRARHERHGPSPSGLMPAGR
ncbi:sigma factor [Marilutibacter chinensis]|uniref:sigma factor n=1 Tax=Marilutibacter chinensis TaxID=2912247 RepID=UPI003CCE4773